MKIVKHKNNKPPLDTITYVIGFLTPIFTLPQLYTVLIDGKTAGVSLITWSFYLLSSMLFASFGIRHREKLLIITYIPFVIIEVLIVIALIR
jgi:uncharacterized protein with PQ loop repeat